MDCGAPSLRGFAPCGRISPDACGGTKWTAKPPLSGDLLPAVAFPLTPAAGFAKGHKRNRSGKPGGSFMSFGGERGIRTPGTHKEFNSFRDCPVRPLRHLSFSILDANITANFQFHQNFHTEFCNVKIIIHICRRRGAVTSRGSPTAL